MTKLILTALFSMILMTSNAMAEQISIDGGRITFNAPDEFKAFSQEMINVKYPSSNKPQYVVGNESGKTSIAYDIKPHNISTIPLVIVQKKMAESFERIIPGLEWKRNNILEFNGRKWVYFEMKSNAVDADIYNMMLFTPYDKKMLVFNFNSTTDEIEQYRQTFYQSIDTIMVK